MSKRRSTLKGVASFRRLLKRMPDSADKRLVALLTKAGPVLADQMRARLPERTGAARAAVSFKVTPTTKNLKVGILSLKLGRSRFFYTHILDVGRRAGTYAVKRGPKAGSTVRLPAMAPLRLEYQGLQDFRRQFLPDFSKLVYEILADASVGASDD